MMKRIFTLIVCIVLCISCVIPVSASSVGALENNNTIYYDILPYLDGDALRTYTDPSGAKIFYFYPPKTDYNYVDVIFRSDCPNVRIGTYYGYLTVVNISEDLYRAYGRADADKNSNYLYLSYYVDSGSFINLLSVKATLDSFSPVAIPYSYKLATPYNSVSGTFSVGSTNVSAPFDTNLPDISEDTLLSYFVSLELDSSIQKKFDYVSIPLSIPCNEIGSIRVNQGDIPVDFTYNFFNPTITEDTSNRTRYIYILIDLTSLDRSSNVPISVYIDGSFASGNGSLVHFHDAYGYISLQSNPVQYWISSHTASVRSYFNTLTSNLSNWFNELINANESANQNADSFNDSIANQDQELEIMAGIMDSVSKPEISDINMNVGGMVDTSVVNLTTSGISGILSNDIIIRVLLIAFTFGMIGFILYGKK